MNFFQKLNSDNTGEQESTAPDIPIQIYINENINNYITSDEILCCITKLKNEKACGEDGVINEYIKSTADCFIHIYEKLVNTIFNTGILPKIWLTGIIKKYIRIKVKKMTPKSIDQLP